MSNTKFAIGFACTLAIALAGESDAAMAVGFSVLHAFAGAPEGSYPNQVILDRRGNLYGTTIWGGNSSGNACGYTGCGTVFRLAPDGVLSTLYSFTGVNGDGSNPAGGIVFDKKGSLYGITESGGTAVYGTIFRVNSSGHETVLYNFQAGNDGAYPEAGLVTDGEGHFYGTTSKGGPKNLGTVFEFDKGGSEKVLHAFAGGTSDGGSPEAALVLDGSGDLYGTTMGGGSSNMGTAFKITPSGDVTILHSFSGQGDGAYPISALVMDNSGNLFGTTSQGGTGTGCAGYNGCGTIFEIAPDTSETVLHNFTGGDDGAIPEAGMVFDPKGNLFGTTTHGGSYNSGGAFEFRAGGSFKGLYSFTDYGDGANPNSPPILGKHGRLYGTTYYGGNRTCQCGVVFRIKE